MAQKISITQKVENNKVVPAASQQTKNAEGVVMYTNGMSIIVPEERDINAGVQLGQVK